MSADEVWVTTDAGGLYAVSTTFEWTRADMAEWTRPATDEEKEDWVERRVRAKEDAARARAEERERLFHEVRSPKEVLDDFEDEAEQE